MSARTGRGRTEEPPLPRSTASECDGCAVNRDDRAGADPPRALLSERLACIEDRVLPAVGCLRLPGNTKQREDAATARSEGSAVTPSAPSMARRLCEPAGSAIYRLSIGGWGHSCGG